MTTTKHDAPRSGHILVLTSAVAIGSFVAWSNWAEIDQITRAPGQVIASSRNQIIQELDGGIVRDILVKEGSAVTQGQTLIRFDQTKSEASYLESLAKSADSRRPWRDCARKSAVARRVSRPNSTSIRAYAPASKCCSGRGSPH